MAILFEENFNSGTFGILTPTVGNPTIVSDIFHSSPYSMRVLNEQAEAGVTINHSSTERWLSYWIMMNRFPIDIPQPQEWCLSNMVGSTQNIAIELTGPRGWDSLVAYSPGFWEQKFFVIKPLFTPNVWHEIRAHVKEGSSGFCELYFDGIKNPDTYPAVPIQHITRYVFGECLGYGETGGDVDLHFDDISLSDVVPAQASLTVQSNITIPVTIDSELLGNSPQSKLVDLGNHLVSVPQEI